MYSEAFLRILNGANNEDIYFSRMHFYAGVQTMLSYLEKEQELA